MVKLDVITTRGGDGGETSLGDGDRVRKDAPRIEAIGAVDEANAAIGLIRLHAEGEDDALLARLQNGLFDLGADLCVPGEGGERLRIGAAHVVALDVATAAMNAELPPLNSFILPGARRAPPRRTWRAPWSAGRSARPCGSRRRRRSTPRPCATSTACRTCSSCCRAG